MEVSLNSDENNVEVEKKGKSKSRKKVPKFLQKKKECLLPMDSKLSREKSPTEKNRSIRQKSPIVPISPYPMINFQIASPGRKWWNTIFLIRLSLILIRLPLTLLCLLNHFELVVVSCSFFLKLLLFLLSFFWLLLLHLVVWVLVLFHFFF